MQFDPHTRVRVEETPDGMRIVMRGRPAFVGSIFLLLWLGGWAVGEAVVLSLLVVAELPTAVRLFLAVWLLFWTVGGAGAIRQVLRNLFGRHVLLLSSPECRYGVRVLGMERLSGVPVEDLRALRLVPGLFGTGFLSVGESEAKSSLRGHRVGVGLRQPELEEVLSLVKDWVAREDRIASRAGTGSRNGVRP